MEDNDSFSPSLSISQCVTLKLKSTNYLLWKTQFESFLSSQSLLGFVNGGSPRPAPTLSVRTGDDVEEQANPEFAKWVRKDQLVMAWLFGSLTEEALRSVYGLHSAQDVWFTLGKKYNRVSATRKLDLQRNLQGMTKGQKTMSEYLGEVKSVCDQLDSIGCPLSEPEMIYGALAGLGKEYESICTVYEVFGKLRSKLSVSCLPTLSLMGSIDRMGRETQCDETQVEEKSSSLPCINLTVKSSAVNKKQQRAGCTGLTAKAIRTFNRFDSLTECAVMC